VAESAPASAAEPNGGAAADMESATERPGLGTVFGESRRSSVKDTTFVRDGSDPFTRIALFYNNAAGVRAQLRGNGGGERVNLGRIAGPGGLKVSLLDEGGSRLETHAGAGRLYVVGEAGQRYVIHVQNPTRERLEVVASVDGLDVIDGKPATLTKRGYVLDPGEEMTIDGFRLDMNRVAAFRFGKVADSYAARTAGDRHVGVIGLAFFHERGARWSRDELRRRDTADPFPGQRGFARPPSNW